MNAQKQISAIAELDEVTAHKECNNKKFALFDSNQTRITDWNKTIDEAWDELYEVLNNPQHYKRRNPLSN